MNFKKRVNGSWVDTPSYIYKSNAKITLDDDLPYYAYGIVDPPRSYFLSFPDGRCFLIPCTPNGTYTLSIHGFASQTLIRLGFYDKSQPVNNEKIPLLVQAKDEYNPTLTLTNSLNLPYLLFQLENALYDAYGFDNVELRVDKGWEQIVPHEYNSDYTISTMQSLTVAQLQGHTISELQGGEWS